MDMSIKDETSKGISAHGMWKHHITNAINTGQSPWTPSVVCQDNQCDFGKWLHGCASQDQASPHYGVVKGLHADFHKAAASALELALQGNKQEAEAAIGAGSNYKSLSSKLTKEMMAWGRDG
jgi:methyl-accepting chemotaxis protein